jgi:MFS family permease
MSPPSISTEAVETKTAFLPPAVDNPPVIEQGSLKGPTAANRYFVLSALTVVYVFNFVDRQLMSILSEPIRKEFDLSYTEVGILTGLSFAIFYAVFGIPLAWFADRVNRVRLIAIALGVWSLFSAACGMAVNFTTLALARIGVGVGEAGGGPASFSLISDFFPPQKRGTALGIYGLGVPLGTGLGAAAGAGIAALYGWRVAFFAAGLPGVVLAVLLVCLIHEPVRGRIDNTHAAALPMFKAISAFFQNPVLALAGLAAGLSGFVGYSCTANAAAFLISNKHMALGDVAIYFSITLAASGSAGIYLGGWLADHFGRRDRAAYALVPAAAFIFGLPFFIGFLEAPNWPAALAFFALAWAAIECWLAPVNALVVNAVPAGQRGTACAILIFLLNFIGLGGGPLYVGLVADHFKPEYGTAALKFGLMAVAPFFLPAVLAHVLVARALRRSGASGGD